MIRNVKISDAEEIVIIYNYYIEVGYWQAVINTKDNL